MWQYSWLELGLTLAHRPRPDNGAGSGTYRGPGLRERSRRQGRSADSLVGET